ncbi:hypothetical protein [Phenylobacterium sp.]|nr:hypothetical protein [Phenylobacterium sp.]MDP3869369.1 hypothetical protein [Phenylobacterium sp.]
MSDTFPVASFHNPSCGASRNTLAMIRAGGYAPTAIEVMRLDARPPSRA